MDFKLVKKDNFKTILITGVFGFGFLIIGLIIIFSLSAIKIDYRLVAFAQLLTNVIFIWIIIIAIHKSQLLISLIYRIETYKNPDTNEVIKSSFIIAKLTHLWTVIFCLIFFILEISVIAIYTKSWIGALTTYWWVGLILFIFNLIILEFSFVITKYLYNTNQTLSAQ